jgi:hypothetical protein
MKTKKIKTTKDYKTLKQKIKNRENFNAEVEGIYYTHFEGIVTKLEGQKLSCLIEGRWIEC